MSCAFIQTLESRCLFSAFALHVNFQPASAPVPAGYVADSGGVFAMHANGFSYGWNAASMSFTRDRNAVPDQRYDTLIHTQLFGARTWEAAVPDGTYTVHLVAGDALYPDSVYKFSAEGQALLSGTPTSGNRWI